ncbi:MAG: hypothetical protein CMJ46_14880 [Planctomyces sp.]|nr:hypothetical protein [Planctomyces sp.]
MNRRLPALLLTLFVVTNLVVTPLRAESPDVHPGTKKLELDRPLDEVMVEGIDRFAMQALEDARIEREANWPVDYSSLEAFKKTVAPLREELKQLIGVVDERVANPKFELIASLETPSVIAKGKGFQVHRVRWPVLEGVTGEGLLILPDGEAQGNIVMLPDADVTPEQFCGIVAGLPEERQVPRILAEGGYRILIPTLISREQTYSGHPDVFFTNQPHREWIYRQAFNLGRHIIGYEVQKVLSGIEALDQVGQTEQRIVYGTGEGGLLALYAGAIDARFNQVVCAGYFDNRDDIWQEPIYRNVWGLLTRFSDMQLVWMMALQRVIILSHPDYIPDVDGPPEPAPGRHATAAPGQIDISVEESMHESMIGELVHSQMPESDHFIFWEEFSISFITHDSYQPPQGVDVDALIEGRLSDLEILHTPTAAEIDDRQRRQVQELTDFTQNLLDECHKVRDELWSSADRSSPAAWTESTAGLKDKLETGFIGRIDLPLLDPNVRTRKIMENDDFTGYEVMLDVFPEVIAGGILLVPKGIPDGEERPLVVCQHGLEGLAMDCISYEEESYKYYKAFAAELAKQGFVTYSPQNPYRGGDKFRVLQRKSNPLARSLYSYIIPQHRQTVRWLGTLPYVDANRIAFYGLSYGGKTAMRVPPFVEEYCLSICSGDFDEWIVKIACNSERYCYVFHGEYEIFEWNMGNLGNYAELASLIFPRPFMVERGHRDGVAPDRWVAAEYAKVRQHYDEMNLGDKTTIEYFNGPHQIHLVGTVEFLKEHLEFEGE